jgi:hypothetical protein
MNWMLFLLCAFAVIGMVFTLGMAVIIALFFFETERKK